MVKRVAQSQLTDRNWQDADQDDGQDEGPMKVAAPQVIQTRQIRGLPKKTSSASAPAPSTSLFGTAPQSNPFASFTPPSSGAFGSTSTTASSIFGTTSNTLFGSKAVDQATSSSSQSQLTTPQSAFSNTSSTSFFTAPTTKSQPPPTSHHKPSTQALTTYYSSLRGLNLSAVSALEQAIKADGFADLDQVFDRLRCSYNKQRALAVKDFEKVGGSSVAEPGPAVTSSAPSDLPLTDASTSLPAPVESLSASSVEPSTSHPFTLPTLTRTESTKSLEPKTDASGSGTNHKGSSRPGAFPMAAPARPSPLRYETEQDASDPEPATKAPTAPASLFGGNSAALAPSFGFPTPASVTTNPDPTSAPVSVFGSKPSSTTSAFSFGPSNSSAISTPAKTGFDFGHGKAVMPNSGASLFGGFGAPKPASDLTPPKAGFNPVGFSFGASVSPPVSTTSSNFFSAKPASAITEASSSKAEVEETPEASSVIAGPDKNEEEEETRFETSGRIYAFVDKAQEDGTLKKQWVGWAVCVVKLNRNRSSLKTRVLARNKTNLNVLVNFMVHKDLNAEVTGSAVKFMGFDNSTPRPYMLRLGNVALADAFAKAMDESVASL